MVCPILEYASTVWSPYTNSNIYKLEMVQRRAARFITNNYPPWASVTEILDHLNLPTLEQRRNNLKLVMMYKMVHRQVHIDNGNYLIPHSKNKLVNVTTNVCHNTHYFCVVTFTTNLAVNVTTLTTK